MRAVFRAALLGALAFALGGASAQAGLLGYWPMDETSGAVVPDVTSNGHNGSIVGAGAWVTGHVGNAIRFTTPFPDRNDRVILNPVVDLDGDWTLAGWYKDLLPAGQWRTMFRGKDNHHHALVQNSGTILGAFDNGAGGGFRPCGYDMATIGPGQAGWHHIAVVAFAGESHFYIDGAYVGTSDFRPTTDLGAIGNNYAAGQRFADYVDDVAAWDEPLAPSQIQALYDGTATPSSLPAASYPALEAWWKLDETTGSQAADATGHGHTGNIQGSSSWGAGPVGGALHFTNAQADRIVLAEPVDLHDEWTITGWYEDLYNWPATGTWRTLARGYDGDHQVLVHKDTGELGTYDNGGSGFHGSGYVMDNDDASGWHHLAAVGHGGITDFYLDGVWVGDAGFQSVKDITFLNNQFNPDQKFADGLDDLAVFNLALADWQISNVMRLGPANYNVPEPATLLIWSLLAGLGIGVGGRRRRK